MDHLVTEEVKMNIMQIREPVLTRNGRLIDLILLKLKML